MRDKKSWLLLLLAVALLGCATARLDRLDGTLRAYERALRWSDFKTAFALADQSNAAMPDFERLQNIQVTSYDKIGQAQASADGTTLIQAVEIQYVNVNRMNTRVLVDKQVWTYTEKEMRWRLTSPFPSFSSQ